MLVTEREMGRDWVNLIKESMMGEALDVVDKIALPDLEKQVIKYISLSVIALRVMVTLHIMCVVLTMFCYSRSTINRRMRSWTGSVSKRHLRPRKDYTPSKQRRCSSCIVPSVTNMSVISK